MRFRIIIYGVCEPSDNEFVVTLAHADSFYTISYIHDQSPTLTTLSVTLSSNSAFSVQMDKRLITVHHQRVICILPCLGTIWIVILPQKSDFSFSPQMLTSYKLVQAQRVKNESSFLSIPNKPLTLLFMEVTPKPVWCSSSDFCEMNQIEWSVSESGIETEEHVFDSCNQFAVDIPSFLSYCFPSSQINHFEYWVLQSSLCCPCCPATHFTVAFAVVTSRKDSKRVCFWPTSVSPEWSIQDNLSEVYATVLDVQSEGCLSEDMSMKEVCVKVLKKRIKWLVKRLYCSESGKPIEYVLKEPTESGMRFLVNTALEDILVTSL